jgi:hypothetical protein
MLTCHILVEKGYQLGIPHCLEARITGHGAANGLEGEW